MNWERLGRLRSASPLLDPLRPGVKGRIGGLVLWTSRRQTADGVEAVPPSAFAGHIL